MNCLVDFDFRLGDVGTLPVDGSYGSTGSKTTNHSAGDSDSLQYFVARNDDENRDEKPEKTAKKIGAVWRCWRSASSRECWKL